MVRESPLPKITSLYIPSGGKKCDSLIVLHAQIKEDVIMVSGAQYAEVKREGHTLYILIEY